MTPERIAELRRISFYELSWKELDEALDALEASRAEVERLKAELADALEAYRLSNRRIVHRLQLSDGCQEITLDCGHVSTFVIAPPDNWSQICTQCVLQMCDERRGKQRPATTPEGTPPETTEPVSALSDDKWPSDTAVPNNTEEGK